MLARSALPATGVRAGTPPGKPGATTPATNRPQAQGCAPESVAPAMTYLSSEGAEDRNKRLSLQPPFCFLAETKPELCLIGISPALRASISSGASRAPDR
ncbi:hypothetical protein NN561_015855 [Cricetulus griseus]